MKAKLKLIATTLLLGASSIAQASFTLYQPLEESRGGALPNGSIGFKDISGSGNGGSGNGDEAEGGQEEPVVKTPSQLCDDSAEEVKIFLNTTQPAITYNSHSYKLVSHFDPDTFKSVSEMMCSIAINVSKSVSTLCPNDGIMFKSVTTKISQAGIRDVNFNYFGSCD